MDSKEPTTLQEYLDRNNKLVRFDRKPRWIERQQKGLREGQDRTSLIYGSWTPTNEGGAA